MFDFSDDETGVTLVEILVTIAVTGILAMAMVEVIRQTSTAIEENRTRTRVLDRLRSAGQKMTNRIRSAGRRPVDSEDTLKFLGIDGDGSFVDTGNAEHQPGQPLGSPDDADHLHLHIIPNDSSTDTRIVCFFLDDGDHQYLEDEDGDGNDEWGILSRDTSGIDLDAFVGGDSTNITSLDDANPIGYNIDYLSFRYYDADHFTGSDTGAWFNEWRSDDRSKDYIDGDEEFPDAIEIAIRAYDPKGELPPRWYFTVVGFNRYVFRHPFSASGIRLARRARPVSSNTSRSNARYGVWNPNRALPLIVSRISY